MNAIANRLAEVQRRIEHAEQAHGRAPGSVRLLAVSKTRPPEDLLEAMWAGQRRFGESYLQEALEKIDALRDHPLEWHFIGRIQSNKTRAIAENFAWVHSVADAKHARRLNQQRPPELPPLNVCLQVMLDLEESKAGLSPDQARELAAEFTAFSRLRLRGLMTLPAPAAAFEQQRLPFRRLRQLLQELRPLAPGLDCLSMGMSDDLEAAVAEGATIVRIGTAIFGPRQRQA
ncbi:MAG: YggS family pyridoxal phosphate-dependent enzyme [Gammaproteobacteria bacterium]|nr:YggS family pyridoxal phosphate-dependent enzyme [Gammaproteobacteria bacterium]